LVCSLATCPPAVHLTWIRWSRYGVI